MTIGSRIRTARRAAGMTQQDLADRTGVRQPNIAAYEKGTRTPSQAMLERLLSAARPRASAVVAKHRSEILKAARRNRASNIRIFGSVARGEDSPDSDVDILVSFEPDASLLDQSGLTIELSELLDRPVDVVSDRALGRRAPSILRDAKPL